MVPWTVGHQAPLSMGFPRQEYWGGLSFPSPGDLPDPGIKPGSPTSQAEFLPSEPPGKQGKKEMKTILGLRERVEIVVLSTKSMYHDTAHKNKDNLKVLKLAKPS